MKAKLIKDRLFLKKIADNYTLHRIKDGILTIEGDSHYTIKGIHPFYKLSLKNCQAIERGYDLDELSVRYASEYLKRPVKLYSPLEANSSEVIAFQKGFQKALDLLGDKKFSEDDVRKAIEIARKGSMQEQHNGYGMSTGSRFILDNLPSDDIIQSLQQTEWDVTYNLEELDADGCLILKRI